MTRRLILIVLAMLGLGFVVALAVRRHVRDQREAVAMLDTLTASTRLTCPDEVDAHATFDYDADPPFSFNRVRFVADLDELWDKGMPSGNLTPRAATKADFDRAFNRNG